MYTSNFSVGGVFLYSLAGSTYQSPKDGYSIEISDIIKNMNVHHCINYIELSGREMESVKKFYANLCGWTFTDYGGDYAAIDNAGIDGGFDRLLNPNKHTNVILYSNNLAASLEQVKELGGEPTIDIFEFPGGRRFHFRDPSGNNMAMWSNK